MAAGRRGTAHPQADAGLPDTEDRTAHRPRPDQHRASGRVVVRAQGARPAHRPESRLTRAGAPFGLARSQGGRSDVASLGLDSHVVDGEVYRRTVGRFREAGVLLPTFGQLAAPASIPAEIRDSLAGTGADEADPRNLFRVHWYNDGGRTGQAAVPGHVVLPGELTGVEARIVVAIGCLFPMIRAHKVLAAYGCLAPRVITGQFDPTRDRAIWPSTGNYCR